MPRDRLVQLVAAIVLVVCLVASGVLGVSITESSGRHRLVYADTAAENDRPEVALGIAMGAFRGVFVNMLWIRANRLQQEGKYYEAVDLAETITKLQPRFPRVWVFQAWNLAYNISVATQTPQERWQWVNAGIRLLRDDALRQNPNNMLIHKELAWIFVHKIQGVTDDANQYYKRKIAEEWTIVLGPPPPPGPEMRDRDRAIEIYANWLGEVADAPETLAGAIQAEPLVEELVGKILALFGDEDRMDTLRRYAIHEAIHRKGMGEDQLGVVLGITDESELERITSFAELMHDPKYENAWRVYIGHLRKRTLIDDYNMDPARMIRYTRKFGPIDWRHAAAHSLYWSRAGVEKGLGRVEERNKKDYDFTNTDRIVMQSIQELFRSSEIYFDFLEFVQGHYAYYIGVPNTHFIDAYADILQEVADRGGINTTMKRTYTNFAAGFENFMADAIIHFYRRGQLDKAEEYRKRLQSWPGRNTNDWEATEKLSRPLDEYVTLEMKGRYTSPTLYVNQVTAALQGAFVSGLLAGDQDLFREQFEWARK
ncbi:MAG TPA: hypothetical protein ENJ00_08970, partial [Phycisphaerales bacterium]|nr:hypothetical protein [Phycisphaerales bacterium]